MHENREISRVSQSNQERGRSEKVLNRTTDAHAVEKSDCADVPMNQPNTGEQSLAEVGAASAQTKENIAQANTSPTQTGKQASRLLPPLRQAPNDRTHDRF